MFIINALPPEVICELSEWKWSMLQLISISHSQLDLFSQLIHLKRNIIIITIIKFRIKRAFQCYFELSFFTCQTLQILTSLNSLLWSDLCCVSVTTNYRTECVHFHIAHKLFIIVSTLMELQIQAVVCAEFSGILIPFPFG